MDIYGKDTVSVDAAGNCASTDRLSGFELLILSGVSHVRNYNIELTCAFTGINKLEQGNKIRVGGRALDKGHALVFDFFCDSEIKFLVREAIKLAEHRLCP
jgi:hypothetical protein